MPKLLYPIAAILLVALGLGGYLIANGKSSPSAPASQTTPAVSSPTPTTVAQGTLEATSTPPPEASPSSSPSPTQGSGLVALAESQVKSFLLQCLQSHSPTPTNCGFYEKHKVVQANWSLNGKYFLACDNSSGCTKVLKESGSAIVKMRFITVDTQRTAPQGRYVQVWNLTCTVSNVQNKTSQKIACQ
jgi:hypothetical protein